MNKQIICEEDDRTMDICDACGGLQRETVWKYDSPTRCSICKLVQPGGSVYRVLRDGCTKTVKSIILWADGNFAVIDSNGNQIKELQTRTACELLCALASVRGYEVNGATFRTFGSDGVMQVQNDGSIREQRQ